jgi:type IV secretory pathway VirB10-like protein
MRNSRPIFDPATRYRIELQGRVDVHWLQSFEASTQISVTGAGQTEAITVLTVQADQSGIVGLVRSLHALGITILQITVVSDAGQGRL